MVSFQYGTSTQLTANPATSLFGHPVTVTAKINPGNPTASDPSGTVTFSDGATPLATAPLSGGQASFTTTKFQPGQHSITAGYSRDQNFAPSSTATPTDLTVDFSGASKPQSTPSPGCALNNADERNIDGGFYPVRPVLGHQDGEQVAAQHVHLVVRAGKPVTG